MNEEKNVDELISRNFTITQCPEDVFQRFAKFCKKETNNFYAMGLKILLDSFEDDVIHKVILEKVFELEKKVEEKESKPSGIKMLGGVEIKKRDEVEEK